MWTINLLLNETRLVAMSDEFDRSERVFVLDAQLLVSIP